MRKRHKIRRNKHHNNRERKQTKRGLSEHKLEALEEMFVGMTPHEIVADLNTNWIDGRWRIVIIDQDNIICDGITCFPGWRIYGSD